ncbi:MAG TPA: hypothetical protein DHW02_14415, partial [Ktedonobacter sp.]|nr:hypothetical protein [Ktedonobacter sp.]
MLVAYGTDNQPIIADKTALEQLQRWSRERVLRCPNCRGIVHIRGGEGKMMQLHFAHQRGECAWSTETESVRHMHGKMVLAQWLREQFPQAHVTLEERLPEPNRIADIFVMHPDTRQWAIEFQCAPLHYAEWRHRHEAYRKANIKDIWIVGDNRREKHESFIEAILTTTREVVFLDPLAIPPRLWLRWLVPSDTLQHLQQPSQLLVECRNLHGDSSATLISTLNETRINAQGCISHSIRETLERQTQLLQTMQHASQVDEKTLVSYLRPYIDDAVMYTVLVPLIKAYTRDPDLMRRYNYG